MVEINQVWMRIGAFKGVIDVRFVEAANVDNDLMRLGINNATAAKGPDLK